MVIKSEVPTHTRGSGWDSHDRARLGRETVEMVSLTQGQWAIAGDGEVIVSTGPETRLGGGSMTV